MKRKQIFAALEIADHEVRLVVGEFHETRFNILRVERVKTTGIINKVVVDEQNIVNAVMKAEYCWQYHRSMLLVLIKK